jgi:hypothetical protein
MCDKEPKPHGPGRKKWLKHDENTKVKNEKKRTICDEKKQTDVKKKSVNLSYFEDKNTNAIGKVTNNSNKSINKTMVTPGKLSKKRTENITKTTEDILEKTTVKKNGKNG